MVSITLLLMSIAFAWCGWSGADKGLAVFLTILSLLFFLWNLALIGWKKLNSRYMLQWMLFLPVIASALLGFAA